MFIEEEKIPYLKKKDSNVSKANKKSKHKKTYYHPLVISIF